MEKYVYKNQKKLRCGITTGTCAAAAATAAAKLLLANTESDSVEIITPKGEKVSVEVYLKSRSENKVEYKVIKDSGDDPDVTNGSEICASVEYIQKKNVSEFAFESGKLYIDGGRGVGRVTKVGFEQSIGQAAINKVPRTMIFAAVEVVAKLCEYDGVLLITINIPMGEKLAKRTFNPRLGIVGGISVLGTSGIIEPMSEKAIIDTIETEIRQKSIEGEKNIIVTPGNYGKSYIEKYLDLDFEKSIKCSNYIGEMLDFCLAYGMENLLLVGNIGKLCKIAAGVMNTHSKTADCRGEVFAVHTVLCGGNAEIAKKIMQCINTEEMLDILEKNGIRDDVIKSICRKISEHITHRTGGKLDFGVMLFSEKYGFLGQTVNTDVIISRWK